MQLTTDVTIKEKTYRISRIDALMGGWILSTWLKADEAFMEARGSKPQKMPISEYLEVQKACLQLCSLLTVINGKPILEPVITEDGRLVGEMQYDTMLVSRLATEALKFSVLDPFFDELASQLKEKAGLDSSLSPTPT